MLHGPCGLRTSPCYDPNAKFKCAKNFPKPFSTETRTDESGYPKMMRRQDGRIIYRKGKPLTNQNVVPYNPYLLLKYNCHINVEVCSTIASIKYLYKYVYKGGDRARVTEDVDEIQNYLDGRYVSNIEACYRLFEFDLHGRSHTVVSLDVHLKDQQKVYFKDSDAISDVQAKSHPTKLTEFFRLCSDGHAIASTLLYHEVPQHFVWKNK